MTEALESKYSFSQLEAINEALGSGMYVQVRHMLHNMAASDIALMLESTPARDRALLWQLIDGDFHSDVLEELSEDVRNGIMSQMVPEKLADALEEMDTDDMAEMLSGLPEKVYQDVLKSLDTQDRQRAEKALAYGDGSAGFLMNTDTITLRPEITVEVILRYLRLKGEIPADTDTFYVVDRSDQLIGTVPVTKLLTASAEATIESLMDEEAEAIPVDMPEAEVAKVFERYNWLSAPVIDAENRLVGRITIDDVVDIIREEAEHSMMSMAGLDDEKIPSRLSLKVRNVVLSG